MDLILWRHAEAEDGTPDAQRALTQRGQRQAKSMAEFLSSRLPSHTRILVSPALRAQQTARALARDFITESAINTDANARTILTKINWPQQAEETVLLVGHQPWLGEIAATLMQQTNTSWSVKKGAIWWFRHRHDDTHIRLVISPEQL